MVLKHGEKLHLIHLPRYEGDAHRHFVGAIEAVDGPLIRVKGYLFAKEGKTNEFKRREPLRTRIVSLHSGAVLVNVLPDSVQIEKVVYRPAGGGGFAITDGSDWHMDITHL